MNTRQWVQQFPPEARNAERRRLAAASGVTEAAIKSYCCNVRQPRPATALLLEKATKGLWEAYYIAPGDKKPKGKRQGPPGISRHDLLPAVYGKAPRLAQAA